MVQKIANAHSNSTTWLLSVPFYQAQVPTALPLQIWGAIYTEETATRLMVKPIINAAHYGSALCFTGDRWSGRYAKLVKLDGFHNCVGAKLWNMC